MTALGIIPVTAPTPRGIASQSLLELLAHEPGSAEADVDRVATSVDRALAECGDQLNDNDLQLTLFLLYLLHYGPTRGR